MINHQHRITELNIQATWNAVPRGSCFKTVDGKVVRIVFQGRWNHEAGPDFKNARLEIDNRLINGDIEIHKDAKDWFLHKHNTDSRYKNIILHVVTSYDETTAPPLETVVIPYTISTCTSRVKCGSCAHIYDRLNNDLLMRYFQDAGRDRLQERAKVFTVQIMSHGLQYTLFRALFRALGYKNNAEQLGTLFDRFWEYPQSQRDKYTEAIIWGESSLLPDNTLERVPELMYSYCERIWKQWGNIRPKHILALNFTRSGSRPYNSIERRIAAAVQLLTTKSSIFEESVAIVSSNELSTQKRIQKLITLIKCSDVHWNSFISFTKMIKPAELIGHNRALIIIQNALLPVMYAYSLVKSDMQLESNCCDVLFSHSTTSQNSMINYVMQLWIIDDEKRHQLSGDALAHQGMIHIYKSFCECIQSDCSRCHLVSI